MTTPRAPPVLLLLLWVLLAGARAGDGDFDLADALDDPEPTSKPSGGSTVARIVSPIVTVVVVALLGAGASYFRSGLQRGCLRGRSGDSAPV
ncbi:glycoprotein Xg isoform X1 [Peromyscus californicus insignis]|uniref:glycoprotein Xg isoform X1 n=1 Tax=Peromyscus californicus insignis TaxID=564181 RepID=UPI0022A77449|nr:glycoprotein Xg isoform X1 [Peromyscus californicus insignis]